jgi:hypothetical protein
MFYKRLKASVNLKLNPLAVLTATPNGINPGMLAGEAVAKAFLTRAGLLKKTTFFRLYSLEDRLEASEDAKSVISACDVGIPHLKLSDPELLDEYSPLFWGDFLHMRRYIKAISSNSPELEARHRAALLLEGRKTETLRRAISYGTSFLFNSTSDYSEPDYGPALTRFLELASHIQMRDAVSSAIVTNYRGHSKYCHGIDPVQLLAIPDIENLVFAGTKPGSSANRALVYFARAKHDEGNLLAFVTELTELVGASCQWLPWGDQLSFPFGNRGTWPWQNIDLYPDALGRGVLVPLLAEIRRSKFVVTDTYHVAVSSWAMGVPAVVVIGDYHDGERVPKETDLRMRLDKRTVLLAQDGLLEFCLGPVLLTDTYRMPVVQRLAEALQNSHLGPTFRSILSKRASQSAQLLLSNLMGS